MGPGQAVSAHAEEMLSLWAAWKSHRSFLSQSTAMQKLRRRSRNAKLLARSPLADEVQTEWKSAVGCLCLAPPSRQMTEYTRTGTTQRGGARGGGERSLSFLQLNCRASETTWTLLHQELIDLGCKEDVLLIQDPPHSVAMGRTGIPGFRPTIAPGSESLSPLAAVLVRDTLQHRSARPFGPRVAAIELTGLQGSTVVISAYIRHTSGEGLEDLRRAVCWALGRSPRLVIGMDANGHSPLWGPEDIPSNAVGRTLEEMILDFNLDVANNPDAPPTFVSDRRARSWIDVTLATRSTALGISDWQVDEGFFSGSDHRAIRFSLTHSPLLNRTFRCLDWEKVDWPQFSAAVASECRTRGLLRTQDQDFGCDGRRTVVSREEAERLMTTLTEVLQGAIEDLVPVKRICWASKPWWSPHLSELRKRMRHLRNRADRLDTEHDRGLFRRARKAFTQEVKKAKAAAWRRFCESVNHADMWPALQRILKPRRRLQVADLQTGDDQWAVDDHDKANMLQTRFFPEAPATQVFRDMTEMRRREVDSWLAEEWESFPPIQEPEIRRRIMEMRAINAPGADGILAKCL